MRDTGFSDPDPYRYILHLTPVSGSAPVLTIPIRIQDVKIDREKI